MRFSEHNIKYQKRYKKDRNEVLKRNNKPTRFSEYFESRNCSGEEPGVRAVLQLYHLVEQRHVNQEPGVPYTKQPGKSAF